MHSFMAHMKRDIVAKEVAQSACLAYGKLWLPFWVLRKACVGELKSDLTFWEEEAGEHQKVKFILSTQSLGTV